MAEDKPIDVHPVDALIDDIFQLIKSPRHKETMLSDVVAALDQVKDTVNDLWRNSR